MSGTSFLKDWGVLIEPFLEWLKSSVAVKVNTGFVISWIEDQSWISSDLNTLGLVGSSIELSNDNVGVILVGFTELFPNWSELLAMSAPWGIVLNKNILGWVLNDIVELRSNNISDWSVIAFWDSL